MSHDLLIQRPTVKFRKWAPGLIFFKGHFWGLIFGGAYIRRGLSMEGNLRFKIDWASPIVGRKFTVFCFVLLCIWGQFPSTTHLEAYIWRGDLTKGFLRYEFVGLIHGGAYSVGCLWHSHGKNTVRLYPKLQSQPIGLPKIFIDYLFFQADQSDCTKSVSIFNRFASSEERWNQNVPCQICRPWDFPLVV